MRFRRDYYRPELSLEERLADAARRDGLRAAARAQDEERYRSVADYDPVLRSHCRLEEPEEES